MAETLGILPPGFEKEIPSQQDIDINELPRDLERLGPTFVKLGQLLSTRADLLPPEYLKALSRLQDNVETMSFETVKSIIEAELDASLSETFDYFDPCPLASASLGQVHMARLKNTYKVAVKIQRPNVKNQIIHDMKALKEIAKFMDNHTDIGKRLGFQPIVETFSRLLLKELDYNQEAVNLLELRSELKSYKNLVIPEPLLEYSSERVLTMDFIEGKKVTEITAPSSNPLLKSLGEDLFASYLQQILVSGFFHADPHPGNILLTPDNKLALLDLGMVYRLMPSSQDQIIKLLLAISESDGKQVADIAIEIGDPIQDFDEKTFRREVNALTVQSRNLTIQQLQAGSLVIDLTTLAAKTGLKTTSDLAMLGKVLLNLDQIASSLNPDFNPTLAIKSFTSTVLRSKMKASSTSLFSSLIATRSFLEQFPNRANGIMESLNEGDLTFKVNAFDEAELLRGLQKLANRVTMGLVLAAMLLGAALLAKIPTSSHILGYPSLAIFFFLLAAVGIVALVVSIFISDRKIKARIKQK